MANQAVVDGIVLAAGASSRMGEPKPLLEIQGVPFLERAVKLLRGAGCRYVLAVVNDGEDWITRLADVNGAAVVINESAGSEQIDSLRLGIANLPDGYDGVLVLPVDFPRVTEATVKALLIEFGNSRPPVLNPAHEGKPGHPVIFSRDVVSELLRPNLPDGARSVIELHSADARSITVDDPGILIDIDTPSDYQQHIARGSNA